MSDVKVITGWAGWCTPCGDEQRPLVLTKAGRFGVRSWVSGVGFDERVLLLTCRVCGGWQHVPWHEEDDLLGLEAAATVAAELLAELDGTTEPAPAEPLTVPLPRPLPQPLTAELLPVPAADAVVGWQPAQQLVTPQARAERLAATTADPYAAARHVLAPPVVRAHQADPTVPEHRTDPLSPELTADLAAALQAVGGASTELAHGPATSAPITVRMPAPAPRSSAAALPQLPVQTTVPARRSVDLPVQASTADVDAATAVEVAADGPDSAQVAGPVETPATAGAAAAASSAVMRVFRLPADGVRRDDAACTVLPLPRPRAAAEVSPEELRDLLDVG